VSEDTTGFKIIHPRCGLDNKNHGRFSETQKFVCSELTQHHIATHRAITRLARMEDKYKD